MEEEHWTGNSTHCSENNRSMLLNLWDPHQPNNSPLLWLLCYQSGKEYFHLGYTSVYIFHLSFSQLLPWYLLLPWFHTWPPSISSGSSYLTEKLKTSWGNPPHLLFFWSAYRKLTTYRTQYWKTLIILQLNTKLSSGTLANNSMYIKMCQQQGITWTSLLTEIRRTFSWTCYRSCSYLPQCLNLHNIRVVTEARP